MAVSTSSLLVQTLEADSFSSMNGIIMRHKVKVSIFALEKYRGRYRKKGSSSPALGLPVYSLRHKFTKEQIINE